MTKGYSPKENNLELVELLAEILLTPSISVNKSNLFKHDFTKND